MAKRRSRILSLLDTLCAALSAILFSLVLVMWVRSYWAGEEWFFNTTAAPLEDARPLPGKPDFWLYQYHLAAGAGKFQIVRRNMGQNDVSVQGYKRSTPPEDALTILNPRHDGDVSWRFAGFGYTKMDRRRITGFMLQAWQWGFRVYTVPAWALALVTGAWPVVWIWSWRRAAGKKPGHCPKCGYDLRATPERCPECGAACKAADPAGESPVAGN